MYPSLFTARRTDTLAALCGALAICLAVSADTTENPEDQNPQAPPIFRTSTAGVMVDVVVRDRTGQPVRGLTQNEFEVFEDGAPQQIIGFAAMAGESRLPRTQDSSLSQPGAPLASTDAQSVVALVFHQLSHQSRAMAVKAARSMIGALDRDEHAGIFAVDLSVTMLAPFTRSTRQLQDALNVLLRTAPVSTGSSSSGGVAETDGPPGRYLSRDSEAAAEMRKRLEAGLEGPQHAAAQAASLTELVGRLARFPGRKAVILFSEGLAVSPRLETVVDRARAENVTIYTINARGLDARGPTSIPFRKIDASELTGTSRVAWPAWSRAFPELDQTLGLGPLAQHSGGFLVSDTNDLVAALRAVNGDRRAFYVLAYVSSNEVLDNSVRHIEVRVKRPDLSVRARHGYIAAEPDTPDRPAYEVPVLQALARNPRPRDFEFVARAYHTPKPGQVHLLSVIVEIPGNTVEFSRDPELKKYTGEVAVLTRLSEPASIVASQSQLYILTGDLFRLDDFRKRALTYFRTAEVRPGSYRLEAVVHDRLSNRSSVIELALKVPDMNTTPVIAGDLIVVRNLSKSNKGNDQKANPLAWRQLSIEPNLGEEVDARRRGRLILTIPLIIGRGPVSARLALLKDGRQLAEVRVSLGKPDKDGRLMPIMEVPIVDLPPGRYDLTLKLAAAGYTTERSTTVTLQ